MTTTNRVLMFLSGALIAAFAFCGFFNAQGLAKYMATTRISLSDQLGQFFRVVGGVSVVTFPLLTVGMVICIKAVLNSRITDRVLRHFTIAALLTVGIHLLTTLIVVGQACLDWANRANEQP